MAEVGSTAGEADVLEEVTSPAYWDPQRGDSLVLRNGQKRTVTLRDGQTVYYRTSRGHPSGHVVPYHGKARIDIWRRTCQELISSRGARYEPA